MKICTMSMLFGVIMAAVDMNAIKFAMKNYMRNRPIGKRSTGPVPLYDSDKGCKSKFN